MRKLVESILSIEVLKYICLLTSIFLVIPYFYNYVGYLKILHAYALIVVLFDFFHEKRLIKNKGKGFFYFLIVSYAITMLINKELFSFSHISDLGYFCIQIFLIFSYSDKKTYSYSFFIYSYLVVITVLNILSIWMFNTQFQAYVNESFIGMYPHEYRLCGFFGNPAVQGFLSFFAVGMVLLSFANHKEKKKPFVSLCYILIFLINFYTLILANSRATILASCIMLSTVLAFYIWDKKRKLSLAIFTIIITLFANVIVIKVSQKVATLTVETYNYKEALKRDNNIQKPSNDASMNESTNQPNHSPQGDSSTNEKNSESDTVVIDRENTGLNGRTEIWKSGIDLFVKHPIFGIGLNNVNGKLDEMNNTTIQVSGSLHNVYLEFCIAFGAMGIILLFAFCTSLVDNIVRYYQLCREDENRITILSLISFIMGMLVIGFADSSLMFSIYPSSIIFFWSLGYLYYLMDQGFDKKRILHKTYLDKLVESKAKNKKDICFVIDSLGGGGAEKVLVTTANALSESFSISIVTLWSEDVLESKLNSEVCLESFDHVHIKLMKRVLYWINRNYLPVKYINALYLNQRFRYNVAFLEGLSTKLVAEVNSDECKKFAWVHVDLKKQNWVKNYFKNNEAMVNIYKKFDEVYSVSEGVKDAFNELCHNEISSKVQLNLVDTRDVESLSVEKDESLERKNPNTIRIYSVGRLNEQKGYDRLIKVIPMLKEYDIELWIIGEGSQKEFLKNLAISLNVENKVTFFGFQDNPYKFAKYCDLFVCSSRAEGFSTVITETLILGKPILSTECAGVREQLGNNEYGMIVDNSLEGIYQGLKTFLDEKDLMEHYSKKAQVRGETFVYSNVKKQFERIFEKQTGELNK